MIKFMGIEYGRGCLETAIEGGPALATAEVKKMFPDANWTVVTADPFDAEECARDRFGENFKIQQKIYTETPHEKHIMIGGDHSVNFGHFAALADQIPDKDLCLVYIDAHGDIHTPETAVSQASGAPHGCNVRALLGTGDERWLSLQKRIPALKPEKIFYLGVRSLEEEEENFIANNNIYIRRAEQLSDQNTWATVVREIRERIGDRPYVVSFDFDVMDPSVFKDVLVPAQNGISFDAAKYLVEQLGPDAYGVEFVEFAPSGDKRSAEIVQELITAAVGE